MSEEQRADGKILLSRKDAVATITFNAPERLNAIEYEMWVEIGSLMPRTRRGRFGAGRRVPGRR